MPKEDVRRIYMPYCLQKVEDGRYVILNRIYKPLGIASRAWVEYGPHAVPLKLTPAKARKLSHEGSENLDAIFLYKDGSIPGSSASATAAYMKRLEALASLKFEIGQ